MQSMRRLVSEFNVYRWAGRMLIDAAELRRRERLSGRLSSAAARRGGMKHILAPENADVLAQLAWSHVLLAFDFDGTLAPIVEDRDRAAMRERTRGLLVRLCALYPCAVISGRSRGDRRRPARGCSGAARRGQPRSRARCRPGRLRARHAPGAPAPRGGAAPVGGARDRGQAPFARGALSQSATKAGRAGSHRPSGGQPADAAARNSRQAGGEHRAGTGAKQGRRPASTCERSHTQTPRCMSATM